MNLLAALRRAWEMRRRPAPPTPEETFANNAARHLILYLYPNHPASPTATADLRRDYYHGPNYATVTAGGIRATVTLENVYRHGSIDPDTDFRPADEVEICYTAGGPVFRMTSPALARRIYSAALAILARPQL